MTVLHGKAVQNDETQQRDESCNRENNKYRTGEQWLFFTEKLFRMMRPNIGMSPAIGRTVNIEQENNDCSSPTSCSEWWDPTKDGSSNREINSYRTAEQGPFFTTSCSEWWDPTRDGSSNREISSYRTAEQGLFFADKLFRMMRPN